MPVYENTLTSSLERVRQRQLNPLEEAQSYQYGAAGGLTNSLFASQQRGTSDLLQEPFAVEDEDRYTRRPTSMIGKAFDLLSRGEYFSASILHSLTNEESETVGQVMGRAVSEVFNPKHRFVMHDVMKNVAPEFVERRPLTAGGLSLAASIALDPLTYLSFGASGIKLAGKAGKVAVNGARGKRTGRYFETVARNLGEEAPTLKTRETAIEGLQNILKPATFDEELVAKGARYAKGKEKKSFVLTKNKQAAYDEYRKKVFADHSREEAVKALGELGYEAGDLLDRGGAKFAGTTFLTSSQIRGVFDKIGLTDVMAKLADLPTPKAVRTALKNDSPAIVKDADGNILKGATTVARAVTAPIQAAGDVAGAIKDTTLSRFSQGYNIDKALRSSDHFTDDLADEYAGLRALAESRAIRSEDSARVMAYQMTKGLTSKERDEVTEVLFEASSESYKEIQKHTQQYKLAQSDALANLPPDGTKGARSASEYGHLKAQETEHEVLQRVVNRKDLTDRQREVIENWSLARQEMARLEADADLLKTYVSNYTPVFHKNFRSSPQEYLRDRRALISGQEPANFTPGKQRVFKTVEHARNAGYEPITDIAQVATLRFSMHKAAMEQHEMQEALKGMFGGSLKNVPKAIEDDLKRVMRVHVDSADIFEEMKPVVRIFDKMQGWFKTGATVLNVAFGAKQITGSEVQRWAGGSSLPQMSWRIARGHKHPAAGFHALRSMMAGKLPEGLVTDFGEVITKSEMEDMLKRLPVMKNLSTEGIVAGAGRQHKRVAEHIDREIALGKVKAGELPEAKGAAALALRATRYIEWPQHIEDINRLATFTDNILRGFTPDEAYKRMEKVHFNYSSGVTDFEDKFMKRLLPFYQFTKFATVLTGNMVAKNPGDAAKIVKIQREAMRAYGKLDPLYDGDAEGFESLTASERHALPGFMFEQPTAFAGFDPELKEAVFRMFGGVQFLDVMNIVHFDDNGEFTVEAAKRTLVQGSMAQVTPFIKAPLEYVFGTEFFTGFKRGEDGSGRRDIDADRFFTALSGALGSRLTGGTFAGAGAGAAIGRMTQELGAYEAAKVLTGWETAVDPRDGVEKTYINPMLTLVTANFLPEFRTALGIARDDLSPAEHVMKNLFGVSTIKLDLQDRRERKLNDATREMRDQQRRYKRLLTTGRKGRAEQAYADLQEAISLMQEEHEKLSGLVRGPN